MRLRPLSIAFSLASLALISTAHGATEPPELSNAQFQQCLDGLRNSSKFSSVSGSTFENYRPSEPDPSVITSLNYQPEFDKEVWDYMSGLVDSERVQDGITAYNQQRNTLSRIEQQYGVKATDVLGVWGVESNFGKTLGKKNLFSALATLSCFDRRQDYFRTEYANALKIVQNGDIRPQDMTGSWAGAFGQTQFMPSTFLRLAQDFDGDGRKDLVNSQADALASTANFLAKAGYRSGEPWGYEVKLPQGYWGQNDRKNKKPISYWQNQGFTLPNGQPLPDTLSSAGLLLPAGLNGPAFLVGKNFDTFYSYNASENYALAIAHLSDLISQNNTNVEFATAWPTDDPGIGRREAREIQQALIARGYNIGNPDGIIGDNTRRAIQEFQRTQNVTPDGRAGMKLYRLIKSAPMPNGANAGSPRQFSQPAIQPSQTISSDRMGQLIQQRPANNTGVTPQPRVVRIDNGYGVVTKP